MEKTGIWRETWQVNSFLVNPHKRITVPALCDMIQETAIRHADHLEIGFSHLAPKNLFWVVARYRLEIYQYPVYPQQIQIESWISSGRGPFSHRNFAIFDEEENLMASASILWIMAQAPSFKPVRIPPFNFPIFPERLPVCGYPEKLPKSAAPFIPLTQSHYYDLDLVGHVNHVHYIQWMLSVHPAKRLEKGVKKLEVNFLKGAKANQAIGIASYRKEEAQNIFRHTLYANDQECCRALICF